MKISSNTHKIITVPKSYLYISTKKGGEDAEYEDLPDAYNLRFLVRNDDYVHNLNFVWLMDRGYLIHQPKASYTGIPTIFQEDVSKFFVGKRSGIWACGCKVNPFHQRNYENFPEICEECGSNHENSKANFMENLWGEYIPPAFDQEKGVYIDTNGFPLTVEYMMNKNKYSKDREIIYRMPPQRFIDVLKHLFRGTIFSPLKHITKEEVENHARKLFNL